MRKVLSVIILCLSLTGWAQTKDLILGGELSNSAATENILLAANALGLGAVWTGLYPDENRSAEVAKVLKLPQAFIPLCTIVIGHPAETPQPKDKWKPENVSYNEYGGKAE